MKRILVWLDWPEKCFRADAEALRFLSSIVPGADVVSVRSARSFLRELPRATHAIVWNFKKEWFDAAPSLKLLATPGAGRELVPQEGPAGVQIHFGGYHGAIISETVAGFMLAWARGFFRPELRTESAWRASWPRAKIGGVCNRVAGTRAVIAGYGRIGRAIGAKLEALGVSVSGFGRGNIELLASAAREADWFIMALPGDTGTDGFLDARLLKTLPRRAVVVNVGRGNAVDEPALLSALRSRRIAGAYLDVFRGEPGPLSSVASLLPEGESILGLSPDDLPENLVMTPHSSAFSGDYLKLCFTELKDEGLI
ncbi:MAG: hypothetical protein K6F50_08195 [Kiritimatiellae bacterium]|nr:hypothetical protein [Kiritimatiellia bacterium]